MSTKIVSRKLSKKANGFYVKRKTEIAYLPNMCQINFMNIWARANINPDDTCCHY